jgi:hypothetical protein
MTFEDDVFVSYAHIDEECPVPGQPGWVTALHDWLRVRLAQLLGKDAKIWRDPQLQGNRIIIESICNRLPRVAVFVSVLSPRYIKSDSCRTELNTFVTVSGTSGGAAVADLTRVFKVIKTPVQRELEPRVLQPLRGYEFFTVEPQSGRMRELGPLSPPEVRQQYYSKLDDLAYDIAHVLATLERESHEAVPLPPGPAPARGAVYLAETSYDLQDRRDSIRRELESHGYLVLPEHPLPLVGPSCVSYIRAELERCQLSIHMVGSNYGVVPEGSKDSIVVMQHDEAIARAASGHFCSLIWMAPELEPSDPRQQAFVTRLQSDSRLQAAADVLRTPLEDFKTLVHIRLQSGVEREIRPSQDGGPKHVYVICDSRDRDSVGAVEQALYSQGLDVISSVFDGDEASVRSDHEESLLVCDAVLIYYGAGGELWFRRKVRDLQKIAGYGRTSPLLAKGVFLAPPITPEKQAFRSHDAVVISGEGALVPSLFEPFIARLR